MTEFPKSYIASYFFLYTDNFFFLSLRKTKSGDKAMLIQKSQKKIYDFHLEGPLLEDVPFVHLGPLGTFLDTLDL